MANITRFNPFDDSLDELFRGFFVRPVSFEGPAAPAQFRVDVTESEGAYVLRAEIPGVKKDDIAISVDGDQVAISAEVKSEKDVKDGERVLRSERYFGKVCPRFHARSAGRRVGRQRQVCGRRAGTHVAQESRGDREAHHHPVSSRSKLARRTVAGPSAFFVSGAHVK